MLDHVDPGEISPSTVVSLCRSWDGELISLEQRRLMRFHHSNFMHRIGNQAVAWELVLTTTAWQSWPKRLRTTMRSLPRAGSTERAKMISPHAVLINMGLDEKDGSKRTAFGAQEGGRGVGGAVQ